MVAELRNYKQAHNSLQPLTVSNSVGECFLNLNSVAASGRTAQTQVTSLPQSPLTWHYLEDAAVVG